MRRQFDVVITCHQHVMRHLQALAAQRADDGHRHHIAGREDGIEGHARGAETFDRLLDGVGLEHHRALQRRLGHQAGFAVG